MTRAISDSRVQVLVVGAGPVGLMAALRLRQLGVEVRIVDQQSEQGIRTFPVVLHPCSLRLLSELGLAAALFWRGRAVTRLAIYTDYERRAVLDLPGRTPSRHGVMTLPQDVVRYALANSLAEAGVPIEWNTRLAVLEQDQGAVWGRLVHEDPAWGAMRRDVSAFEADFVIGADGYDSSVRQALGLELTPHGPLESYAFFDAPTHRAGTEAQLAFSDEFANSVYPLQGELSRFSFQVDRGLHRGFDLESLQELIALRLPWFKSLPETCDWSGVAEFRHALVSAMGRGRVWLAGDAAHLIGPLGVQSLNVGLDEANELALAMADCLRRASRVDFGAGYDARRLQQWRELLGIEQRVGPSTRAPSWARRHVGKLLTSLPASAADLDDLLDQLRLTPSSSHPPL